MKKVYSSKIDFFYLLICLSFALLLISNTLNKETHWILLIINVIAFIFLIHLIKYTKYIISNEQLLVQAGIVFKKKIEISSITKIKHSRSLQSSPALSLDRLEIFYSKYDSILISPKEKEDFIQTLLALNSNIVYDSKGNIS